MSDRKDVLIGYSRFAATEFASAAYAFRFFGDDLGTLRQDTLLKAGEAKYVKEGASSGLNRWGDYSATVLDPVNPTVMWTIQEYAATPTNGIDRWSTWWGQISPHPIGEFDLNGHTEILWRHQGSGNNVIWRMNGATVLDGVFTSAESDVNWMIGGTTDMDFNGFTDILWHNPVTGGTRVWYMAQSVFSSAQLLPTVIDLNWRMAGTGDFNYDGQRDILW